MVTDDQPNTYVNTTLLTNKILPRKKLSFIFKWFLPDTLPLSFFKVTTALAFW